MVYPFMVILPFVKFCIVYFICGRLDSHKSIPECCVEKKMNSDQKILQA